MKWIIPAAMLAMFALSCKDDDGSRVSDSNYFKRAHVPTVQTDSGTIDDVMTASTGRNKPAFAVSSGDGDEDCDLEYGNGTYEITDIELVSNQRLNATVRRGGTKEKIEVTYWPRSFAEVLTFYKDGKPHIIIYDNTLNREGVGDGLIDRVDDGKLIFRITHKSMNDKTPFWVSPNGYTDSDANNYLEAAQEVFSIYRFLLRGIYEKLKGEENPTEIKAMPTL